MAILLILAPVLAPAAELWEGLRNLPAAREAESGARSVAEAAWWGFDPDDATAALQSAINSRASVVRIANLGRPWIVRPIQLRSHLELQFEPGVVILAKAGEFRGGGDCLFRAQDATHIILRGTDAVLRMRKRDYQQPPYPKAEWRMGVAFYGCQKILVEGLRIESSGGDGIYIGSSAKHRWCEEVRIRNCVCHDNFRQGISVISAVNLRVEDCVFSGTQGTPPAAGIDLEPDTPDERLVHCVFRNCRVEDNHGNGMLVYLKPLTRESEPVSIRFENCVARMGRAGAAPSDLAHLDQEGVSGIAVGWVRDAGPRGLVEFVDCTSENTGRESVRVVDKSSDGLRVRFSGCRWTNSWSARHRRFGGYRAPILIESQDPELCRKPGGIDWNDCVVVDSMDGPTVRFSDDTGRLILSDLQGVLRVQNPGGARLGLGLSPAEIGLRLETVGGPP